MKGGGLPESFRKEVAGEDATSLCPPAVQGSEDAVGRFVFNLDNWYVLKSEKWVMPNEEGEDEVQEENGHILILKTQNINGVESRFGTLWAKHTKNNRYKSFKDYGWIEWNQTTVGTHLVPAGLWQLQRDAIRVYPFQVLPNPNAVEFGNLYCYVKARRNQAIIKGTAPNQKSSPIQKGWVGWVTKLTSNDVWVGVRSGTQWVSYGRVQLINALDTTSTPRQRLNHFFVEAEVYGSDFAIQQEYFQNMYFTCKISPEWATPVGYAPHLPPLYTEAPVPAPVPVPELEPELEPPLVIGADDGD